MWVNEKCLHVVCGLGVFQETLAKRSFDTFAQKHGEPRCGQASTLTPYWHSVSAEVVKQTANILPHHTSQCTSGDDAFPTQVPKTNRSLRFVTGVGRLCGN